MNILESRSPISRFYYDAFFITALSPGETLPTQTEPPTMSPTPPNAARPIGNGEFESSAMRTMTLITTPTTTSVVMMVVSSVVALALWAPFF